MFPSKSISKKKKKIFHLEGETIDSRFPITNPVEVSGIHQGGQVDASREKIILSIGGKKEPWILGSLGKRVVEGRRRISFTG